MGDTDLGEQEGLGTEPAVKGLQRGVYMRLGGKAPLISGPITAATLLVRCVSA